MKFQFVLLVFALALVAGAGFSQTPPASVVGGWKIDVRFGGRESHALRFEARVAGKGSFAAVVPAPNETGPTGATEAEWSENANGSIAFSGPVQFPLGNVGLERGTLVLQGKLQTDGSITGEAKFFPVDQDPSKANPLKSGTFKAIRQLP
ncbi:MAG: hypothetical protein ABI233_11270 [Chthoniobacterales bacterium]